ncbi:MAG: Mur ligase family protein [Lutisporaceae bacterium]
MLLNNFERFGVTADCKKVLPGMVFVDLNEDKNRKEIYKAFDNGASLIFTTQNITDPKLPVIKISNVYETMLILLNKHFNKPQDKVRLIAVSGSNDKAITLDLLYKLLEDKSNKFEVGEEAVFTEYVGSFDSLTIEDMYEYLDKFVSTGMHLTPMIVDYKMKYFKFINGFKFDCALITGVDSFDYIDSNYAMDSIRSFISQIPEGKPIFVNNDDSLVLQALESSKNNIVVTYGLNKKAAVTATSIDINEQTNFNYCLQRSFTTSSGNVLEPFEMPISINMLGSGNIYNALAAITCALYYDVDMLHIRNTLMTYNGLERRFKVSGIKGVCIVDNYSSSPGDLDKTFEGVQMLNYSRLLVLMSTSDWEEIQGYIKVFNQWSELLGIAGVILTGCVDIDREAVPISIHDIRTLKRELKDCIKVKYIDSLQEAVKDFAAKTKAGDLLVLVGSNTMNTAKKQLKDELFKKMKTTH